ncbi:MAG: MAPEG family protein [Cryobacterium sp.]|nr:MAPEG family protein [Oligoflexia bacterium]
MVSSRLKLFSNSVVQGVARSRAGVVTTPEDVAAFGSKGRLKLGAEPPLAERAGWLWENDLENVPLFLFLALADVLTGGRPMICAVLFGTYFLSQVLHSVALLRAMQPMRSISYVVGVAVCFTISVRLVIAVLG